jgi:uncharacterized protein YndB with AHSA1/START domain
MRSTIDLEKGTIRIEIEIEASPEAVFDALTDPKELAIFNAYSQKIAKTTKTF